MSKVPRNPNYVNVNERAELAYWTEFLDCTESELKYAVRFCDCTPDEVRKTIEAERKRPRQ